MSEAAVESDAWNPGLSSEIPARLLPMVTLYRAENSTVAYRDACDAASFCGMKPQDMVAFTPRRLVIHELLIRVTADLNVPDGPNYADLGLSLRGMVARILDAHVQPHIAEIESAHAALRAEAVERLTALYDGDIAGPPPAPVEEPRGLLGRLFGAKPPPPPARKQDPEIDALASWQRRIADAQPGLERACLQGLHAVVSGIVGQRGRLVADRDLVIRLAADRVCNGYGSARIGEMLVPIMQAAATAEGYRFLPSQSAPVILNVKGASAAGKSTIRPLQRQLAERLGVPWEDFALVSPDYWRKFLLDYDSLGPDLKYAAMLTGQELEIIDKKLDAYMESKAARHEMPHLLIDRFRFDSFASSVAQPADSRLLSRFGDRVFMFFVITPPAETVERAWKRGLTTGRYKAVDDLLYHNVEAYTGMPQLFFTWVKKDRQNLHFEFLDNSVPLGDQPRTLAYGWNDRLTILDIDGLRCLNRYRRVNVDARRPEDVLPENPESDEDFVMDCIARIREVTFVDPRSMQVVGHTIGGKCDFEVEGFLAGAGLTVAPAETTAPPPAPEFQTERTYTVGAWPGD